MRRIALLLNIVALMALGTGRQMVAQDMALKSNVLYDVTTTINLGYEIALNHKTTLDIWLNYNPWTLGNKWVGLYEDELAGLGGISNSGASASKRDKKLKHLAIQPEVRWWLCEKFNGHFFGAHLHGGLYNIGALKLPFDWGRYKDENGDFLGSYPVQMRPVGNEGITVTGIGYHPSTRLSQGIGGTVGSNYDPNDIYWENADRDGIYVNSFEGWFVGAGVSYGYHWVVAPRFSMEFTVGAGYAFLKYDKNRCTDCVKKIGDGTKHYFGPTRAGISLVFMLK